MDTFLAFFLFLCACHCTAATRFVQFRRFFQAVKSAAPQRSSGGGLSPFQAAATSLAATIGTGNISGVAAAILVGGPGVLFWMWISALTGMASKYLEIYLGIRYSGDQRLPGPLGYMSRIPVLGRALAPCYAVSCGLGALCMGNLIQVSAVTECARVLLPRLPSLWVGVALAALVGVCQFGGVLRIGRAAAVIVPFMSVIYLLGAGAVIIVHRDRLPAAFQAIFSGAWRPEAFLIGIARGMFTHEAGLGTAPLAHGCTDRPDPHRQALYGIFEVFFDTIVICSVTALAILTYPGALAGGAGSGAMVSVFAGVFGERFSAVFLTVSLSLFAFTSILSFSLYGELCVVSLFHGRGAVPYRILFLLLLAIGACVRVNVAWLLTDWTNFLMAVLNMTALIFLTSRKGRRRPLR